jgi:hypothetical protein
MKARWLNTFGVLLACATLSTFVACGDDDGGDGGVAGGGGAAGTAGGGAGMSGGAGGSKAGSGGSSGTGGAVMCGGKMCTVNSTLKLVNPAAAACCTTDMKCGQYNGEQKCLPLANPGTPDTSCPSLMFSITVGGMPMNVTQAGCCLPNKMCGNDYTTVGWGCVARPDIDMAMGAPMKLPALMCGMGDGGGDAGL